MDGIEKDVDGNECDGLYGVVVLRANGEFDISQLSLRCGTKEREKCDFENNKLQN